MKRRSYLIYGVAAYLFFLVASLPASLVVPLLIKGRNGQAGRLEYGALAGPWWSGEAAWLRVGGVTATGVEWHLRPLALFMGELGVGVRCKLEGGSFAGGVGVGVGGYRLSNVKLRLSLAELARTLLPGFTLDGQVELKLKKLTIDQGVVTSASGELELGEMAMRSPLQVVLGDFKGKVATEAEGVQLTLNDAGGPLRTQLLLRLPPQGGYTLTGNVAAADPDQPGLADLVGMLGRKGAGGQVVVNRSGKLPQLGR